uniref:Ig-like domain-containing protein n=1 Tax=Chinchilla lanigera TaxID=34839 RepID=A0A8C2VD90_CHILA
MLWAVALLLAFLPPAGSQTSSNMDEGMTVMTRPRGSYVEITCTIHTQSNYIHWYQFQEGRAPRRLLYYDFSKSKAMLDSGVRSGKYDAYVGTGRTSKFVVRNVEESDSGVYYCAVWTGTSATKTFGRGTKLVVTDKSFNIDTSPKPTMFLPSITEIDLHKTGTYLCLLENFFPEDIKVYWKEKDSNTILKSQQGDTMKTKDTYMKFSWLTVTGNSMAKEHRCIVKHEKNKGGVENEILFPSINTVVHTINSRKAGSQDKNAVATINPMEANLKDEIAVNITEQGDPLKDANGLLSLQLTNTSAYYTYLLLMLKSALYGALVTFCLCRMSAVCCNVKTT